MKTDYLAHDDAYRNRKAKGQPGWADAKTLASNLQFLDDELKRGYAPTTGKVLELGCGAGDLSLSLAERGFETHGIDVAPFAIEWAKEKASERNLQVDFIVDDAVALSNVPNGEFDFVLDGYCLHCIIGSDRFAFLRNAFRVLKTGAPFLTRTMCGDISNPHLNISSKLRDSYDVASRCVISRDGTANRYFGMPETIVEEVTAVGFDILDWRVDPSSGEVDHMDTLTLWAKK